MIRLSRRRRARHIRGLNGYCLQFGPSITACGEPGIAGRLDTRGASTLRLRVRAWLASAVYATLGLAIYLGEAQSMPLEPALEHTFVRETMTDVPPRDTEWIDLELALNAVQQRADLPFELRAIYHCPSYLGASRTPAMYTESAVLIDHIGVE